VPRLCDIHPEQDPLRNGYVATPRQEPNETAVSFDECCRLPSGMKSRRSPDRLPPTLLDAGLTICHMTQKDLAHLTSAGNAEGRRGGILEYRYRHPKIERDLTNPAARGIGGFDDRIQPRESSLRQSRVVGRGQSLEAALLRHGQDRNSSKEALRT